MKALGIFVGLIIAAASSLAAEWVTYEGRSGPGKGKHIVMISGDEEYRSEEALPMLGKILAVRHGFKVTVLFPINPETGEIDPNNQTNVVGLHHLKSADLVYLFTRFREFPDEQMKHFDDYLQSGKPLIAIRTSTHAFQYSRNKNSKYAHYDWRGKNPWVGGFGQEVLGETWISHHGVHAKESARGVIVEENKDHPVLRGVKDVWGPSDVYGVVNLKPTDKILMRGQVLKGMKAEDAAVEGKKNDPMMPMVWIRDYKWPNGKTTRSFTSTIGAAVDLQSEDMRRMFVNASYWLTGLEVPQKANVEYVGSYEPTFFSFNGAKKGVKPSAHELRD
ncbi:MAG TPA: ThuA domain-containing protein [Methylomirabilota bacterium]|nr:ThuA domain-containing protein [Methylomirabilota bacterium]